MDPDSLSYDDLVFSVGKKWADDYYNMVYRLYIEVLSEKSTEEKPNAMPPSAAASAESKEGVDKQDEDCVVVPSEKEQSTSNLRRFSKFNGVDSAVQPAQLNDKPRNITHSTFRSGFG
jgi:hypothetical protein